MKISVCLPYMERDFGRKELKRWCQMIDDGPFHALSCGERITGYTLEMRNMLAFAAACTERVRIVPSLYVLPMHNAVWAAKEIATLDVLSEGRVSLTVGVGGREMDYKAVGADFKQRHARMDEQIATMQRIWQGEPPFEGAELVDAKEVGPKPVQTHIPILAGVMGEKPMARAAQWADGVYAFAMDGSRDLTQHFKHSAEQKWQQSGRATTPYFAGGFWFSLVDESEAQLKNYVYQYLLTFGEAHAKATAATMTRFTEDAVLEGIKGMEEAGCDEIFLVPASASYQELERLERLLVNEGLV